MRTNRFIQYIGSRTRSGDSELGYIHYFDGELLKQVLTEEEYLIVKDFLNDWNSIYQRFHPMNYDVPLSSLEIGPRLSYIRKNNYK